MSESPIAQINKRVEEARNVDPKFGDLDLSELQIVRFTPEIKTRLQVLDKLELLYLVGCGIQSLENFPALSIKGLDISRNQIDDNSNIKALTTACPQLEQLLMSENAISNTQTIIQLCELKNLYELDFRNNPVISKPDTNQQDILQALFQKFKNIEVINTRDANGNCIEFCDDIEDEDDDEEDEYYEDDVEEQPIEEENEPSDDKLEKSSQKKKAT